MGKLSADDETAIEQVVRLLVGCRRVLFITGAGISAESGLPTYRGVGGLYEDADTPEGLPIEVLLSGQMMRQQPELCWKYIGQVEAACRGAVPNDGHRAIVDLQAIIDEVWVLTQNVDGFHRTVGTRNLIEIHGNLHRLHCTACPHAEDVDDYDGISLPPSCDACGALVRPAVVLFGEALPTEAVDRLYRELDRGFDMVLSVGTTSVFPYIAEPVLRGRNRGIPTVEINPGSTEVSHLVGTRIRTGAARALPEITQRLVALAGR